MIVNAKAIGSNPILGIMICSIHTFNELPFFGLVLALV
jgi:hypothetical protein